MGDNHEEYRDMVDNLSPCIGVNDTHSRYDVDVGVVISEDFTYWITADKNGNILAHTLMIDWPADEVENHNNLPGAIGGCTGVGSCYNELLGDPVDLDDVTISRADQDGNVALGIELGDSAYVAVYDADGNFVRDCYFNFACSPSLLIENEPAHGVVMEVS